MLDNVADGFLGLFMFLTQWLSPGTSDGDIRIAAIRELDNHAVLECVISIEWNERMNDLVDAGIPVNIRIISYSEQGDTVRSIHSLTCDVTSYTYTIRDSLISGRDSVRLAGKYRHIYRAVKAYQRFDRAFLKTAMEIHIEAELLPSRVNRLNRSIDLSEICGARKFSLHMMRKGWEK